MPGANYNGPDGFSYTASDGYGGSATGTVSFAVAPVNDPPVGPGGGPATIDCGPGGSCSGNVLTTVTDSDGDVLTVTLTMPPMHGMLVLDPDGSFTYTAYPGYTGPDGFGYQIKMTRTGAGRFRLRPSIFI